ncbi:hypothetical protein ACWKW6_20905 [Dyadobacter jiangsuensis]|uniref:hypothetical protein n=1 Tax=Dyadobacter fermentans TaxID=94254 RepID=UPI001CBB75B7|nr:hypothetical protein [Dyadobacter fermentans]MBZ1357177.1 hypothetical protein [Dyadobacter fermentans]
MVEVFKTTVEKQSQARLLIDLICLAFTGYRATFDLEDCDKVLRISCDGTAVCHASVIGLLESFGYEAAVLEDTYSEKEHSGGIASPIHSITI